MPFVVEHRGSTNAKACPADRPWGVYTQNERGGSGVGDPHGCHETEEAAKKQQQALYVHVPEARALEQLDEQQEVRSAAFQPIDVADDGSSFDGYAAVFDEVAMLEIPGVGQVEEEVRRGAFRRALASGENVPMLYHHLDMHPPLATTRGGTLRLEEDAKGLRVRAEIARGYIGDAVRELVARGDIPGMSWGFIAGQGNSKVERRGAVLRRTLTGFKKILDVSPTWDPTYRGTVAEVRSRTFGFAFPSVEAGELLVVGAREQSGETAPDSEHENEGDAETRSQEREKEASRAVRSIAARKRALHLFIHETGGYDDAS